MFGCPRPCSTSVCMRNVNELHRTQDLGKSGQKLSSLNVKYKRKKHSQPQKRFIRLIFHRTRKQKNSHSETFVEVGTFKSIVADFSASAPVHFPQQQLCRSAVELHMTHRHILVQRHIQIRVHIHFHLHLHLHTHMHTHVHTDLHFSFSNLFK